MTAAADPAAGGSGLGGLGGLGGLDGLDVVRRADRVGEVRAAVVVAVLTLVLGGPIGVIWAAVRPHIDPATAALQESVFDRQMTIEVWLLALGLLFGAAAGALAWVFVRAHATAAVIGLAVGGALAMVVAARIGPLAAHAGQLEAQVSAAFRANGFVAFSSLKPEDQANFLLDLRFRNRAPSLALVFPAAACAVFAGLTRLRSRVPAPEQPPAPVFGPPSGPPLLPGAGDVPQYPIR